MKIVPHDYAVGDEVSYGFNGDWYPCGKVMKVTKCYLTTTTNLKFSKYVFNDREMIRDAQGKLIDTEDVQREGFHSVGGGTWTLCKGHISELNPEF